MKNKKLFLTEKQVRRGGCGNIQIKHNIHIGLWEFLVLENMLRERVAFFWALLANWGKYSFY